MALLLMACDGSSTEVPDAADAVDATTIDASLCVPSPSSVEARWRADESTADETGRYDATALGNPSYTTGKHGAAFLLQGAFLRADPDDALFPAGSFSVETWVRLSPSVDLPASVLAKSDCGGNNDDGCTGSLWELGLHGDGTPYFGVRGGGSLRITATLTPLTDHEWHHLVGVRDVTTPRLSLYVDGVEAVFTTANVPVGALVDGDALTDAVTIGAKIADDGWVDGHFYGAIDEAAFYFDALTADEVSAIYAAPQGICP